MKQITLIFIILLSHFAFSQQENKMTGSVFSLQTNLPIENVDVVNLNQVKGTITNIKGEFSIRAAVNDTLHFSLLGYKSVKIRVTSDMIKFSGTKIGLSELAYAIEEVIVTPYKLTGILEVDAKNIPINTNGQYSISGLEKGYEARGGAVPRILSSIADPVGSLHKVFGSKPKQLRKLKKVKKEDELRTLLMTKFDRVTISEMLGVSKSELEKLLLQCKYSSDFIKNSNDLQFLDALTECYEEFKLLVK